MSVVSLLMLSRPTTAAAFCRLTTCDANNPANTCRMNESGCVRDGVALKWKEMPIVYRFHRDLSSQLDASGARMAIRRAFDSWGNVECSRGRTSLRFEEGPDIQTNKPLGALVAPEKFGIYFRDDEWPYATDEALARTNQLFGAISGFIDYADIEINTFTTSFRLSDDEGRNKIDLQAVMTHEVGHYIGLAHSNDPESIMVARYCLSADRCGESVDIARGLSDDDRRAVCTVYPPRPQGESDAPAACAQSNGRGSVEGGVLAFALGFVTLAFGRRRARAPSPEIGASSKP